MVHFSELKRTPEPLREERNRDNIAGVFVDVLTVILHTDELDKDDDDEEEEEEEEEGEEEEEVFSEAGGEGWGVAPVGTHGTTWASRDSRGSGRSLLRTPMIDIGPFLTHVNANA